MKLDITTANVLRERLNTLRSQRKEQEGFAMRDALTAQRSKDRLAKTKVEIKAVTATLRGNGYPVVPADYVPTYEPPEQTSL